MLKRDTLDLRYLNRESYNILDGEPRETAIRYFYGRVKHGSVEGYEKFLFSIDRSDLIWYPKREYLFDDPTLKMLLAEEKAEAKRNIIGNLIYKEKYSKSNTKSKVMVTADFVKVNDTLENTGS